jgi:hypothetical protein
MVKDKNLKLCTVIENVLRFHLVPGKFLLNSWKCWFESRKVFELKIEHEGNEILPWFFQKKLSLVIYLSKNANIFKNFVNYTIF